MPTLTLSPTYPVPGRPCLVTFTASGGGNYARAWITDAPMGSELRRELDKTGAARKEVFAGDVTGGGEVGWRFTPDKPGGYVLAVQEYTRAGTGGGGYAGSPKGYTTETKVGSETTLTAYVAHRLTRRVGTGQDLADLVVWVHGTTLIATDERTHGEKSPALVNARTMRARVAARSSAVETALAAMGGTSLSGLTTLAASLADLRTKYEAHRADGAYHVGAGDTVNTINVALVTYATHPDGMVAAVNAARLALYRHMTNDAAGAGVESANYHDDAVDWTNLPTLPPASDLPGAVRLMADLWRAYEAHRADAGPHDAADVTNTLAALPTDLQVDRRFAEALAASAPTAPASENGGAVALLARGFADG